MHLIICTQTVPHEIIKKMRYIWNVDICKTIRGAVKYNLTNCILTHYGIFVWIYECKIILPVIYEWIVTSGFVVWYGLQNISLGEVSSFNLSSGAILPKYAMSSYSWFCKCFSMLMLKMEWNIIVSISYISRSMFHF